MTESSTCLAKPRPSLAQSSNRGPRGLVTDEVPTSWQAGALLVEAGRCVAASLVQGRAPRNPRAIRQLLGRVMQARLQAAMRSSTCEAQLRQLDTAAQSLRTLLDDWQAHKSHWLEWIIIALITVDIVVCML